MGGTPKNHAGRRFGMWIAIELADNPKKDGARWLCRCDCGTEKIVPADSLVAGKSRSCGCSTREFIVEGVTKHGQSGKTKTPAYGSWHAMLQRCENENSRAYPDYGGRGITVCERWKKFVNFYEDMGDRPPGLTLDRIRVNEGYGPGNCRWATRKVQQNNRRPDIKNRDVIRLVAAARVVVAANDNQSMDVASLADALVAFEAAA